MSNSNSHSPDPINLGRVSLIAQHQVVEEILSYIAEFGPNLARDTLRWIRGSHGPISEVSETQELTDAGYVAPLDAITEGARKQADIYATPGDPDRHLSLEGRRTVISISVEGDDERLKCIFSQPCRLTDYNLLGAVREICTFLNALHYQWKEY